MLKEVDGEVRCGAWGCENGQTRVLQASECAYVGVSYTQTRSLTESPQWAEHRDRW